VARDHPGRSLSVDTKIIFYSDGRQRHKSYDVYAMIRIGFAWPNREVTHSRFALLLDDMWQSQGGVPHQRAVGAVNGQGNGPGLYGRDNRELTITIGDSKMNFIIWIIAGAFVGWIASMIMRTNARQGLLMNIVVGIVGAFLGGLVLSPLFGVATINQRDFSMPALLVSLGGALLLLFIVQLVRRGR
jgi:uncharacterized membrane protein YeaQ/YmgE (transglycosylase-associated protein family)